MWTGLSESVTLTLVVFLVVGSVCFYLYSRILLNENRMSLIESLLMDLKMSTDLRGMSMEGGDNDDVRNHTDENSAPFASDWNNSKWYPENTHNDESKEVNTDDEYGYIIAKAVETSTEEKSETNVVKDSDSDTVLLASADGPSLVSGMPINQEMPLPSGNGQLVSNLELSDSKENTSELDSPFLDNLNDLKLTDNAQMTTVPNSSLESMTAKELHSLAKQRKIPGESKMNRAELIEALRQ